MALCATIFPVLLYYSRYVFFQLVPFLLQFRYFTGALLRCVRWQLAPVYREHFPGYQLELAAFEQYLREQIPYFPAV